MGVVSQILGMTFIGIVLICLVWAIGNYLFEMYPHNKLEDNMKKFDREQNERKK